jgi:hypothetical protein
MNRRLIISLAPLLATAAFAVMPAAAQAAPHHWFSNGVQIPEGEKVPTVSWGTLEFFTPPGKVDCRTVIGGYVENPAGGGGGVDAIQAFNPYECTSTCPGALTVTAEGLPWRTELIEVGGVERDQIKNIALRVKCFSPGPPEDTLFNNVYSGNNDPVTKNGTAAGKPSELRWPEPGAGTEELQNPELGPTLTEGRVKTQGYNATELITNK